jgi:hypothetical protein
MSAAVTLAPLFQPDSHHEADGAAPDQSLYTNQTRWTETVCSMPVCVSR